MNASAIRREQPLTVTLLSALVFIFLFTFSPRTPAAADGPAPELYLQGDFTNAGLRIGSDLEIGVLGGDPWRSYTVLLVDEGSSTVASLVDLMTNQFGSTGRHRLWTRTGVEGCDANAVHDPASYRFESFSEAEAILDGRTFRVILLDSETSPLSTAITERNLPLIAVTSPISAYPSDGAGCLRTQLDQEPLHLAVQHRSGNARIFQVFVVAEQSLWLPGDPLVDVRTGGPQTISVPAGAIPSVELLWASPVTDGEYQIILRDGSVLTLPPFLDATADLVLETPVSHTGTTYRECLPVCPPPK